MTSSRLDLVARMMATQKTVDAFKGRKFDHGRTDCVRLVLAHAEHMGRQIEAPRYGSRKSAVAVMKQLGVKTLGEAMDRHFSRIEPHRAMMGDIVEGPGANGFSALGICVGNGRMLGFHEDIPFADILQPRLLTGAWRIE